MNFASWTFILLFLPATVIAFRLVRGLHAGAAPALLIGASLLFYAWSGLGNAIVLAASIAFNFAGGRLLVRAPAFGRRARHWILWTTILANVGLLAGFKIAALASSEPDGFRAAESILIPLALSFVTFQQIGFATACYRGSIRHFTATEYLFFIAFFPQLVMGPIVRFADVAAQLRAGRLAAARIDDIAVGLSIFTFGIAQKVLLADQLAPTVDGIFGQAELVPISTMEAWFAITAFQLQLYFDFAGYADMAIGLGRMFGIRLPANFDRPLFAIDRFDLWRRWHISFVIFMRSHVFMPLVRHWRWPVSLALAATGLLSGLWHGLGWTFVIWGFIQTAILLIVHWRRKLGFVRPERGSWGRVRAIVLTFLVSALVGAMFRAPTLAAAANVYGALGGLGRAAGHDTMIGTRGLLLLPIAILAAWGLPNSAQWFRRHWNAIDLRPEGAPPPIHPLERRFGFALTPLCAIFVAAVFVLCLVMIAEARRFVYVQF
jgi:alginate O-acetyltransferase complex protein AlgI